MGNWKLSAEKIEAAAPSIVALAKIKGADVQDVLAMRMLNRPNGPRVAGCTSSTGYYMVIMLLHTALAHLQDKAGDLHHYADSADICVACVFNEWQDTVCDDGTISIDMGEAEDVSDQWTRPDDQQHVLFAQIA